MIVPLARKSVIAGILHESRPGANPTTRDGAAFCRALRVWDALVGYSATMIRYEEVCLRMEVQTRDLSHVHRAKASSSALMVRSLQGRTEFQFQNSTAATAEPPRETTNRFGIDRPITFRASEITGEFSRESLRSHRARLVPVFGGAIFPRRTNESDGKSQRAHDVACLTFLRAAGLVRAGAAELACAVAFLGPFRFAAAAPADFLRLLTI